MSFVGTFGSFTTARLGIYAAQKGLSVTGNNIANINTRGYTRQALDQISLRTGGADRYQSVFDARVGSGVLCTGVSQLRDPYLDIRYRSMMANVGAMDTKLAGLNELASILDEVAKGENQNGVIDAQFSDLMDTLQKLTDQTGLEQFDSQVRASATALVKLFQSYANRLEEVENNTVKGFKQDIETVNKILTNIRDLNTSIRKAEIHGDAALELRDERNRLIDDLSQYMKIDVVYSMEDIGAGQMVEKLTIKLGNANPDAGITSDSSVLVDGVYAAQINLRQAPKPNPNYIAGSQDPNTMFKFLKPDGTGTDNEKEAALIDSPNYNLRLSDLRDIKNKLLETVNVSKKEYTGTLPPPPDSEDNNKKDGILTKTTYEPGEGADGNPIWYEVTTVTNYSVPVNFDDNDLYGSLQSSRELLTESGEFASQGYINGVDEDAASKRGIPYYRKALDLLANKFATAFNEANNGYMVNKDGAYVNAAGDPILDANGIPLTKETYDPTNADHVAAMKDAVKPGGDLFSSGANGGTITAGNITISDKWATGEVHIVNSYLQGDGSTGNSNILHLVTLMNTKLDYFPNDLVDGASESAMFHGTFQEMLGSISSTLGNDQRSTSIVLNTHYTSSVDLDTSRDAVSGVDLNDEAASLMQYQKSYAAACRLMTTLDEALDKLINGTGTVGR